MAVTTFTPPAPRRGYRGFAPTDRDLKTAVEALNNRQWILIDETAATYKGAGRYIRGWKAALLDHPEITEDVRSITFAADARTGETVEMSRDSEPQDGVVWRVGLALASTPVA